jgi:hypothetical protein
MGGGANIMRRDDTATGRFYEIDGRRYPSVTTILSAISKPALVPWAANAERAAVSEAAADLYAQWAQQTTRTPLPRSWFHTTLLSALGPLRAHQKQLVVAGDLGSETHRLIEWAIRMRLGAAAGPEPVVSAAARHGFEVFDRWAASVQLKPILVERCVYSTAHGYAGTLDLLARVNGQLTVIDMKTSRAIYGEALVQVAAYRQAMIEMGYAAVDALIVRIPKTVGDPAFEVRAVPEVETLFPVFLAAKAVWTWQQAQQAPARKGPRRVA